MSKTQTAYLFIKNRISSSAYAPGHRLVLSQIAEELGSSVVPVREALRQLEAEGMVDFEPNVGARVSMVDRSDYLDCMHTIGILEGAATALAAPHLSAADIAAAREVNGQLQGLLGNLDPKQFTHYNFEFHRTLFSRCPNAHLVELVLAEWERLNYLRESTFAFVPNRAQESVQEHEKILTLIEINADASYVEQVAREHRLGTLRSYLASRRDHPAAGAERKTF